LLTLSLASLTSLTLITFFYFIFLSSVLFYLLPISKNLANFVAFKKTNVNFEYITSFDFYSLITLPFFLSTIIFFNWTAPLSSAWFGNLLISSLQIKISYFYFAFTLSLLFCLTSFIYFNSREVYDFFLVLLNFLFWIILIFFSNNIFSLIFIVEITSTLIFLIFITSTFSSTYFSAFPCSSLWSPPSGCLCRRPAFLRKESLLPSPGSCWRWCCCLCDYCWCSYQQVSAQTLMP